MKNFETMTTKKLKALLNTASDEDKQAIQEVLNAREQVSAELSENEELTAEEQAAIEYAETHNGENPMHKSNKPKMTDEERTNLAKELKEKYLHHKCQVVLYGTVIWTDGYIAGVVEEKRANTVLFRIKLTETGKVMHKAYDSELIKIFDEVATVERKTIVRRSGTIDKTQPWAAEDIEAELSKYLPIVGRACEVTKGEEKITGRITGLVPEKRQRTILIRIAYTNDEGVTKYMHKVGHEEIEGLTLLEADAEFEQRNAAYINRNNGEAKAARRTKAAPQERVFALTAKLESAKKALVAAEERYNKITQQLAEAQAELDASLNTESQAETNEDLA